MSEIEGYRAELAKRRAVAKEHYARFRELGNMVRRKYGNVIAYSAERHEFYQTYYSGLRGREIKVIRDLMKLQKNIQQQAMLLLELEHSIDHEEKKL